MRSLILATALLSAGAALVAQPRFAHAQGKQIIGLDGKPRTLQRLDRKVKTSKLLGRKRTADAGAPGGLRDRKGFAVDASLIEADANKSKSLPAAIEPGTSIPLIMTRGKSHARNEDRIRGSKTHEPRRCLSTGSSQ